MFDSNDHQRRLIWDAYSFWRHCRPISITISDPTQTIWEKPEVDTYEFVSDHDLYKELSKRTGRRDISWLNDPAALLRLAADPQAFYCGKNRPSLLPDESGPIHKWIATFRSTEPILSASSTSISAERAIAQAWLKWHDAYNEYNMRDTQRRNELIMNSMPEQGMAGGLNILRYEGQTITNERLLKLLDAQYQKSPLLTIPHDYMAVMQPATWKAVQDWWQARRDELLKQNIHMQIKEAHMVGREPFITDAAPFGRIVFMSPQAIDRQYPRQQTGRR